MRIIKNKEKLFLTLIFIGYISLFINLNLYEFRNEESLRTIVSFEMKYFQNWFQPTVLGEYYYLKPPLFNWLIITSSFIFKWSEFTARFVSLLFLGLTMIGIYIFSYKLLKDKIISLLSTLIYLTFIDILFWYGYLAEIDITLTFFVFITLYFQLFGFLNKNQKYIYISGILVGITFLLKGFPAYLFYALTFVGLTIYTKRFKEFFNPAWWIATSIAITIPIIVFLKSENFYKYINSLLIESLVRAEGETDITKFFKHILTYPLLNFKQLLPTSLFFLIGLFMLRRNQIKSKIPDTIKILIVIVFINYLPYLLAVESRGRYIIPLFPFIAIIFAFFINKIKSEKFLKSFYYTLIVIVVIRLILGIVGFPILMKYKESRRKIAYDIAKKIDISKNIAFDCTSEKSVALYLDFIRNKPVVKSKFLENWDYLISCNNLKNFKIVEIYKLKKNTIYLYKK